MRITHFFYACLCLLFSTFQLFAQQGFTAAGGEVNSSNGSVSYSYGQIDYQNYDNQDGKITEGIQQPFEILTSTVINSDYDISVDLFPNPTTRTITLSFGEINQQLFYQLIDLNGRIILSEKIRELQTEIDLDRLVPSVYFINILDKDKIQKSFKILKK